MNPADCLLVLRINVLLLSNRNAVPVGLPVRRRAPFYRLASNHFGLTFLEIYVG
jgi:hypothetical protein